MKNGRPSPKFTGRVLANMRTDNSMPPDPNLSESRPPSTRFIHRREDADVKRLTHALMSLSPTLNRLEYSPLVRNYARITLMIERLYARLRAREKRQDLINARGEAPMVVNQIRQLMGEHRTLAYHLGLSPLSKEVVPVETIKTLDLTVLREEADRNDKERARRSGKVQRNSVRSEADESAETDFTSDSDRAPRCRCRVPRQRQNLRRRFGRSVVCFSLRELASHHSGSRLDDYPCGDLAEIHSLLSRARVRLQTTVLNQTEIRLGPRNLIIGISTNDAARLQGHHAENILILADEAPGISADFWPAVQGILSSGNSHLLLLGNPVVASGQLYEAFGQPVSLQDVLN